MKIRYSLNIIFFALFLFITNCKKETLEKLSSDKEIISFVINSENGIINEDGSVLINGNYNWDISQLTPVIEVSINSTITPKSGETQDFSNPVIYTVTAQDGSTNTYEIKVNIVKNNDNKISAFTLHNNRYNYIGRINNVENTIEFDIPFYSINKDTLYTNIQAADSAVVIPVSGNLIGSVYNTHSFTVTAQNGEQRIYDVVIRNNQNSITYFEINELPNYFFSGFSPYQTYWPEDTVGLSGQTFGIMQILKSDDVSSLCPEIHISELATMTPSQNNTCQDFNQDVEYIVTSQSGTSKKHIIRLIKHSILFVNDGTPSGYNGFYEGDVISLRHRSISDILSAELINEETGEIIACDVTTSYSNWDIYTAISNLYPINTTVGVGSYRVKVYLQNGEEILTRCGVKIM